MFNNYLLLLNNVFFHPGLPHEIHNITDSRLSFWYSIRGGVEENRSAALVAKLIQSQFVSMSPNVSQGLREFWVREIVSPI